MAVTSFTPDEFDRERYLICSTSEQSLRQQVAKIADTIVAIENYYHLVMLPMKAFSRAVDQIHDYEQRHLYQRAVLIEQLGGTTPQTMQKWLTVLTQDLLQVSRLAESMRIGFPPQCPMTASSKVTWPPCKNGPMRRSSTIGVCELENHRSDGRVSAAASSHRCHGKGL